VKLLQRAITGALMGFALGAAVIVFIQWIYGV
jgi:hypothetical protein